MPIMSTCNCPEKFPFLLASAVTLLTIIYIAFGELCYYTFGNTMDKPIILEMMPADNPIIIIVKMLFCINLACSYPLCIYPVNLILESYLFKNFQRTPARKWLKNLSRGLVVASAAVLAVVFSSKLDKFLSLLGALLCAPLAFTIPTLCHYKLIATTRRQKIEDMIIVCISFVILVFCTI